MIHFVLEYQHKRELYIIIIVANNLSVNQELSSVAKKLSHEYCDFYLNDK